MSEYMLNPDEAANHRQRLHDAGVGRFYSLRDKDAQQIPVIFDLLQSREAEFATPNLSRKDYEQSTALFQDEIATFLYGDSSVLVSSEHSTPHIRTPQDGLEKRRKIPEAGTAALGSVAASLSDAQYVTMRGLQTGDPNHDVDHAYKDHLMNVIKLFGLQTYISVHGMASRHISDLNDERCFDILAGVGDNPGPQTSNLGKQVVSVASSFGLRAAVNAPLLRIDNRGNDYYLEVDDDGRPVPRYLKASEQTTRGATESRGLKLGLDLAAVSIEFGWGLRLMPKEAERDPKIERLGSVLGVLTLAAIIKNWSEISVLAL